MEKWKKWKKKNLNINIILYDNFSVYLFIYSKIIVIEN